VTAAAETVPLYNLIHLTSTSQVSTMEFYPTEEHDEQT